MYFLINIVFLFIDVLAYPEIKGFAFLYYVVDYFILKAAEKKCRTTLKENKCE